ncbi:MAG TPA: NAD(P)-dependent oxidoreductase [Candidatus Binatia bacterium]|nr:NAD(P)-dependent oxidoreductase [Candidatus Binatia bacterium]
MKRVGVIGLGKMGSAIARNLLARGYDVSVWDRSSGPIQELVAAGAAARESPEALVGAVDDVIVMLWDDNVAREVSLGRVIPSARKDNVVIETSTLSPQMYETLAKAASEREIGFLAAPVIGSVDAARQGTLTILPGGEQAAFDQARDLLAAMGSTVTYTGSPTASAYLKLTSNTILGIGAATWGELLGFCESAGVDRRLAIDIISLALGRVATGKTQQIVDRDTAPRFSLNALLKDLRLARDAAQREHVAVPIMENVLPQFEAGAAKGLGDRDYIALALALEAAELA